MDLMEPPEFLWVYFEALQMGFMELLVLFQAPLEVLAQFFTGVQVPLRILMETLVRVIMEA